MNECSCSLPYVPHSERASGMRSKVPSEDPRLPARMIIRAFTDTSLTRHRGVMPAV